MVTNTDRPGAPGHRPLLVGMLVALVIGGSALTGCGVVSAVKNITLDLRGNKATIDAFTKKLQTGGSPTFEATYMTTGSSPTTVVYAVAPPKGLSFSNAPTGAANPGSSSGRFDVIANSNGEYACTPPSPAATSSWSCDHLSATGAAEHNKIFSFYTPSHWVTFLNDFALAAGFAGDKVRSSSMTVNGFAMRCVDFSTGQADGESTICTTAQDILGYVKVAGTSTEFEIVHYTTSPPSSLFALPTGAKVTTVTIPKPQ